MSDPDIGEREIELRLSLLKYWYGNLLTDEQWEGVREGVFEEDVALGFVLNLLELGHRISSNSLVCVFADAHSCGSS